MAATIVPTYEALAADIKNMSVECVFGLMSDDTALFGLSPGELPAAQSSSADSPWW